MAGLLDQVNLRTQLVGENRLELLMFKMHGDQIFAINVFKVQEVQQMPKLTLIPQRHPIIVGVTHVRGQTIPVIDLSKAIDMAPIENYEDCNVIITEYSRSVQAFMVGSVERIVNLTWDKIAPPPIGAGEDHYLTAITRVDDHIVEVIDVEKVLAKYMHHNEEISEDILDPEVIEYVKGKRVLLVDDSTVARAQMTNVFQRLEMEVDIAHNGIEAWNRLISLKESGVVVDEHYLLMVTDAEMPGMDGYRLTFQCREDEKLRGLYIVMHTSMSGDFNQEMVKKVKCDGFISKFEADALATMLQEHVKAILA